MPKRQESNLKVEPVSPKELLAMRNALAAKYGARLRAGESLAVDAERAKDHVWVQIVIEATDQTFRLEFEAASVPADATDGWVAPKRFDLALDLADSKLEEYFENDRFAKLHDDWRFYEFDGVELRFRGVERRPHLDQLADQWLEAATETDLEATTNDPGAATATPEDFKNHDLN